MSAPPSDDDVKDLCYLLLIGMRGSLPADLLRDVVLAMTEVYRVPPALRPLLAMLAR
jgi:hypothetical protein